MRPRPPYRPAMRFPFVLVLLATLVACGSEPSTPPPADVPPDNPCATAGQPCGCAGVPARQGVLECVGGGVVCVCATPDASTLDVPGDASLTEDRGLPMDVSRGDASAEDRAEVANDATPVDRPTPRDVPPPDVPPGECAEVERSCTTNADCAMCTPVRGMAWCCGRNAGRSFCMVPDANGFCAGVTITPTEDCGKREPRCRFHADCAVCIAPAGSRYCCSAGGSCLTSARPCF